MKFISMPKNGSSWRGRLPYSFSTESEEPQDVTVEILDRTTGSVIGAMRLYGVIDGEVDIAPYVRPYVSMRIVESSDSVALVVSPSAICVVVRIGEVVSDVRTFFRAEFDYSVVGPLSDQPTTQVMLQGENIRMTVFALSRVDATISFTGGTSTSQRVDIQTHGMPVELIANVPLGKTQKVVVSVRCDSRLMFVYHFEIMQRVGSAQRVLWYNRMGGVESYLFDHAKRLSYEVKSEKACQCDGGCMSLDGLVRYRLCSGYEPQAKMERVAQLVLSPVLYRESGGVCHEVDLENREVTFDSRGMLRSMTLDMSEKWEGGELW